MPTLLTNKALSFAQLARSTLQSLGKRKVFCIGKIKTGTTSLKEAFYELGLVVGDQSIAERYLLAGWAHRDFRRILLYCYTAQAFQDIPFSLPYTFQAVDLKFPSSQFILTVRDSPEQWFNSLTQYYAMRYGHGHLPTVDDLKAANYISPGWVYQREKLTNKMPLEDLFDKDLQIAQYNAHNNAVMEYFRHRPQDLLVLNVAEPGAYDRLCDFLGKPRTGKEFPWKNRTATIDRPS